MKDFHFLLFHRRKNIKLTLVGRMLFFVSLKHLRSLAWLLKRCIV